MASAQRVSSLPAFSLSLLMGLATTADAVDLSPSTHTTIAGDFNGDGRMDALFQPLDEQTGGAILLQDGQGNLTVVAQGWNPGYLGLDWSAAKSTLTTADLNGDGRDDVLVQPNQTPDAQTCAGAASPTVAGCNAAVLITDPTAQLLKVSQLLPPGYLGLDWSAADSQVMAGDFDGDHQKELLLQPVQPGTQGGIVHADLNGNLVAVIQALADGYLGRRWNATDVTLYVGDFNGDGRQDLLMQVKAGHSAPGESAYALLLADPDGRFTQIVETWNANDLGADWNPTTHKILIEDANGDGMADIVLLSTDGSTNYVFTGNSQGTFIQPTAHWTGPKSASDVLKAQKPRTTNNGISVGVSGSSSTTNTRAANTSSTLTTRNLQPLTTGNNPVTADSTGELAGSGGASGGAGTYTIPLAVPPGIAGTQPALSLNYSSKGGNGDLGMGWSLSGLSAIHRCPSTQAQDGRSVAVNYSSTDRLCLDGQHLVLVSGTYGATGAVYRTEMDSGVRITEFAGISSVTTTSFYFEVDYQDGRQAFYGYETASNSGATVVPAGAPAPLVWAESREQDAALNNIVYFYGTAGGEYHIVAITYTGKSSGGTVANGSREIQFSYTARNDPSISYLAGGASPETEVLTSITTWAGATEAREYDLAYTSSAATTRSLLQSVQECGFDLSKTKHCLPATTFTWQNGLSFSALQNISVPTPVGGTNPSVAAMQASVSIDKDYLGDGRRELLAIQGNTDPQLFWLDGSSPPLDLNTNSRCDSGVDYDATGQASADFDDDGKAELACIQNSRLSIVGLNSSGGVAYTDSTQIAVFPSGTGSVYRFFGDFNGDGLTDVISVGEATQGAAVPLYFYSNKLAPGGTPQFSATGENIYNLQTTAWPDGLGGTVYTSETMQPAEDLDGNGVPDFFIFPAVNPLSTPGPTPASKILFLGTNPDGSVSTNVVPYSSLNLAATYNGGVANGSSGSWFMDINGDGLPDLVYVGPNASGVTTWQYQLNLGNQQFAPPVDTGVTVATDSQAIISAVPADVDNDGSQEMIYADATHLVADLCVMTSGSIGPDDKCGHTATQYNRDVYMWNILKFVRTLQSDGSVKYVPRVWGAPDQLEGPVGAMQAGDLFGDGLTTVFANYSPFYINTYYPSPQSDSLPTGYAYVRNTAGAPDLMTGASSGLGRQSTWQYRSLTDLWVTTPPTTATSYYYVNNQGSKCTTAPQDPAYYCFTTSMYVVSDYQQSDETGGMRDYQYGYEDAVYNSQGRGFQGFRVITEFDLAANKERQTTFRQDFPFSGKPTGQTVTAIAAEGSTPAGTQLYSASYQWQDAEPTGTACLAVNVAMLKPGAVYWVQPVSSTATSFDAITGAQVSQTVTNYLNGSTGYDVNGNSLYVDSFTTDATGAYDTQTSLTYSSPNCGSLWTNWVQTKSVQSTVTYANPVNAGINGSITRNFTYIPNAALRKLQEEKDDTNDTDESGTSVTSLEKDATYGYDSFGNVDSVTVSTPVALAPTGYGGLSNSRDYGFPARTTTTTYTSDGYFVSQVKDSLGHVATFDSYELATGQPTSVHAADGVASSYAYDAFGRKVQETDGPLPTIYTSYTASSGGVLGPAPTSGAVYAVSTTQAGYPSNTVYFDLYGKPLREAKDSDRAGYPSLTDTTYDNLGRLKSTTEPYFYGDPVYSNRVDGYDVLDRPTHKTDAEGVGTGYVYAGLTTTITTTPGDNSFGGSSQRLDVETRNSLGKLLSVENAQGTDPGSTDGTTQFRYDAQGNPVLIQDAKGNQTLATYNLLGQKTQVADPNMGTWTYAYDVLGEMLQQTDAKNQVTMQGYDPLGRMTARIQPESQPNPTAIWCYDGQTLNPTAPTSGCTGSAGQGAIGKLSAMGQSDGYSELYSYDGSGRPINVHTTLGASAGGGSYDTATAYDPYSRVASTTYPASIADTAPVVSASVSGGTSTTVALSSSGSASVNLTGNVTLSSQVFNAVYTWSQACGAKGCGTLSSPNAVNTGFTATAPGVYILTLTVTDGFLTTTSNTVTVTVKPGAAGRPSLTSDNAQNPATSFDGQLSASWAGAPGATYYTLYQSTDGGQSFTPLSTQYTTTSNTFSGMGSQSADYTYEYEAQACDEVTGLCGAVSPASTGVIVTYLPSAVTSVAGEGISNWDGSFDVTWTASSQGYVTQYNAELYEYDAETHTFLDDGFGCSSARGSSAPAATCHVPPSTNGFLYYVAVEACNVSACTGYYPATPVGPTHIILAPTSLYVTPSPSANGNYTLSWTAPTGLTYTSFNVYQSYNGGAWTTVGNTTTASWPFIGQSNGTYSYYVTGCISTGQCSRGSPTVTESVQQPPSTPQISGLSPNPSLNGSYTLSWSAANYATSYKIYQSTNGGSFGQIATTSGTSYPFSGMGNGSYTYYLVACNSYGCSGNSGQGTEAVAPSAPSISSSNYSPNQGQSYTISWTVPSGPVTGYVLAIDPGPNALYVNTTATSKTYSHTLGDVDYYYQVQACNGSVCGAWSTTIDVYIVCTTRCNAAPVKPAPSPATNASPSTASESITVTAPVTSIALPTSTDKLATATLRDRGFRQTSTGWVIRESGERPATSRTIASSGPGTAPRMGLEAKSGAYARPTFAQPVYQAWRNLNVEPASSSQVVTGLQVAYGYTSTGYLSSLSNALSPSGKGAFWTLGHLDAHGNVVTATDGNGVTTTRTFNDPMGRITSINTVNASGTTIQNNSYSWYRVGNLQSRQWQPFGTSYTPLEQFTYDVLNRLKSTVLTGTSGTPPAPVNYAYDALGNITCKTDVTTSSCSPSNPGYTYGQGGEYPHAVTAIAGTVNGIANPSYSYDADGNMANRSGTNVVWNSLNLPTCTDASGGSCTSGSNYSSFKYAPDKHRYQQVAEVDGVAETTAYIGAVEFLTTGSTTTARHRLSAYGEDVLTLNIGDSSCAATPGFCFNYIHNDQLGGVDAVTGADGKTSAGSGFAYEAFGQRRDPATGLAPSASEVQADRALTHHGFTNHEMLDGLNLIHMNGRVYDPTLGRFLSVDPIFMAETNGQSLNPYSYVMNNPLSVTDPTGYVPQDCINGNSCPKDAGTGTHIAGNDAGVKGADLGKMQAAQGARFMAKLADAVNKAFGAVGSFLGVTKVNGQAAVVLSSNGQENQTQGAGSTLATSQGQGGGASQTTASVAATVNQRTGAPAAGAAENAASASPESHDQLVKDEVAAEIYAEKTTGTVAEYSAIYSSMVNRVKTGDTQYVDSGQPITLENVLTHDSAYQGIGGRNYENFFHGDVPESAIANVRSAMSSVDKNGPVTDATFFIVRKGGAAPTTGELSALGNVVSAKQEKMGDVYLYKPSPPH